VKSVDQPGEAVAVEADRRQKEAEAERAFLVAAFSRADAALTIQSLKRIAMGLSYVGKNKDGSIQTIEQIAFNEGRRSLALEILRNANIL